MDTLNVFLKGLFNKAEFQFKEKIQSLWSGYGSIERWFSKEGDSIVVKHIKFPNYIKHPKGWNSDVGHQRKVKSYEVETTWYKSYASNSTARLPRLLAQSVLEDSQVLILEDLNSASFDQRISYPNEDQIKSCISWLAQFHACFLNKKPEGLWDIGTYWHLDTRPDELASMKDGDLKSYAREIDEILNSSKYQTFVHGDAKLANFCFSRKGKVAAVDFQYVGRGCGMKDLIYFISSVEDFESIEREKQILDFYFDELAKFLGQRNYELEYEWRGLYKYAWADFNRFLQGWSPGHWKLNDYVDSVSRNAIAEIKNQDVFPEYLSIAQKAALQAGEIIANSVGRELNIQSKGDGLSLASSIITQVDGEAQSIILSMIKPTLSDFGILSEELKDDASRFEKEFFWSIDPLDGTLPFTEGVDGYSVAISVVSKFGEPILGVIYNPKTNTLYSAQKGKGAFKNGKPFKVEMRNEYFTLICDRSLLKSDEFENLKSNLEKKKGEIEVLAKGGASMNAMWVLENAPAAYIKVPKSSPGGGGLWDFAASACIFAEMGQRATNYFGGKLDLNRADSIYMNHEGVWFES